MTDTCIAGILTVPRRDLSNYILQAKTEIKAAAVLTKVDKHRAVPLPHRK